ncbi:MAG: hypothetical protein AAF431_02405 [Pseudomonadota bacterium]
MSISYKKINSMISAEVDLLTDLSEENRVAIRDLCQRIYMLESSLSKASNQQIISEIKGEVTIRADSFVEDVE